MFVLFSVTFVLLDLTFVSGYASYCDVNQTLFVPKGDAAIFNVNNLRTDFPFLGVDLQKTDGSALYVISIFWHTIEEFTYDDVQFIDKQVQNRTEITVINPTEGVSNLEIKINDLQLHDNGTYYARVHGGDYTRFCWVILVLDLQQIHLGRISEDQGVRILGQPAASLMERPVINATMIWLLDGNLLNETEYFVIQDGAIWTAKVPRVLNGKNVTYRAIQDTGSMSEINLTLTVAYGPDIPLTFSPLKSLYTLKAEETMPEIRCAAVCNPLCSVSWGNHSSTDVLRIGTVSVLSSGEYTCIARSQGNGTIRVVERSVYLVVTDNTDKEMTAIAVLATMQVLTTLFLGLLGVVVCRRFKRLSWKECANAFKVRCQHTEDRPVEMSSETNIPSEHRQHAHQNGAYIADYVDLNAGTRQTTSESGNYSAIQREGQTLTEMYENTKMSQS